MSSAVVINKAERADETLMSQHHIIVFTLKCIESESTSRSHSA